MGLKSGKPLSSYLSIYSKINLGSQISLLEMSTAASRCDFEGTVFHRVIDISSN